MGDNNWVEGTQNTIWVWKDEKWEYVPGGVTNEQLVAIFKKGKAASLKEIETSINLEGNKYGINSKKSLAHFLSQAGHEVGGFTKGFNREESLNYSVDGLMVTFSKYFYKGTPIEGKLNATEYGRIEDEKGNVTQSANQEAIANKTYANRMGNGNFESGDGYRYRGRGPFQLTGKAMYQEFTNFLNRPGVDFVSNPSLLISTTEYAIKSSMWYYKAKVIDVVNIEEATVTRVSTLVNGDPPNGLADRQSIYNRAIEKLK